MTKKRKSDYWSEVVQVLLTAEMKAELVRMAEEASVSQSAFTRSLLSDALSRERKKQKRREREALQLVRAEAA